MKHRTDHPFLGIYTASQITGTASPNWCVLHVSCTPKHVLLGLLCLSILMTLINTEVTEQLMLNAKLCGVSGVSPSPWLV